MPTRVVLALALAGLALRLGLIHRWIAMPWGDAWARAAATGPVVVADWLPGYQATLRAFAVMDADIDALRAFTAVQGAAAVVAAGAFGPVVAAAVALHPTLVLPGTALYQESLFVALLLLGLARVDDRPALAVGALGAACLVRYEGWIAAAVAAVVLVRTGRGRLAFLLAVPILGWVTVSRGLSPVGTSPLQVDLSAGRVVDTLRVWRGLFPWWIGAPALVAAAVGLLRGTVGVAEARLTPAERRLLAVVAVDLAFVLVARPYSPPENARQLVLPLLGTSLLAGVAARGTRFTPLVPALLVLAPCVWVYAAADGWNRAPGPEAVVELAAAVRAEEGARRVFVVPEAAGSGGPAEDACKAFAAVLAREVGCGPAARAEDGWDVVVALDGAGWPAATGWPRILATSGRAAAFGKAR